MQKIFFQLILMTFVSINILHAQVNVQQIQTFIDNDQFQKAEELLAQAAPEDPTTYYGKGLLALAIEKTEDAKKLFEAGIAKKKKYPYNYIGLGRVYYADSNSDEAIKSLKQALNYTKGDELNVKLAVAKSYIIGEQLKDAEVLLIQVQEKYSSDPQSYILLGDYYLAKKEFYSKQDVPDQGTGPELLAIEQYEKAIELDPNYLPSYVKLGALKIEVEKYDDAYSYLKQAVDKDPNYALPYRYIGELYLKAQRYEQARDNYQKYLSLSQNDVDARLRYAGFLFLSKNYQEAVTELQALPSDLRVGLHNLKLRLLGMSNYELEKYQEAETSLKEYFEKMDEEKVIFQDYEYYGKTLLSLNKLEEAISILGKAVIKNPDRNTLFIELADQYQKEKNFELEAAMREASLDYSAKKSLADYYKLGRAQYFAEQYDKAEASFEEVIKLKDDYVNGYVWLARAAQKLDSSPDNSKVIQASTNVVELLQAKKASDKLSKTETNYLKNSYLVLIGHYYAADKNGIGNCEAAMPYVDRLIEIDPEQEQAKALKEYCSQ